MQKADLLSFFDSFEANINSLCKEIVATKQQEIENSNVVNSTPNSQKITMDQPVTLQLINLRKIVRDVSYQYQDTMNNYENMRQNAVEQMEDLAQVHLDYKNLLKKNQIKKISTEDFKSATTQKIEKALGRESESMTQAMFTKDADLTMITGDLKNEIELRKQKKQKIEELQREMNNLQKQNEELQASLEKIDENLAPVLDKTDRVKSFYQESLFGKRPTK